MRVGQTFLSDHVRQNCHPKEAAPPVKRPRKCLCRIIALQTIKNTGDSSTTLRMTCWRKTIREVRPIHERQTCHPEEAVLPARASLAGRLTKDLLRHRLIPA